MRYLQTFHRRLGAIREAANLSRKDVAHLCSLDEAQIAAWEAADPRHRRYPSVTELLDFCLHTSTPLDSVLDLEELDSGGQLELPGLTFSDGDELATALGELEKELARLQLSKEEAELLRRFRKTSSENRRLILQLLGR